MSFSTRIQDYKVVKNLGSGTYGIIQEVTFNEKTYAIKIQNSSHSQGISCSSLVEIDTATRLNHFNLIKCLFAFTDSNKTYMLMEKADGDLKNLELKWGKEEFISLIFNIFCSVEFLHTCNLIHGDINPKNFLIFSKPALHLKLADFGFTQKNCKRKKIPIIQTSCYRAPEVIKGDGNYQESVDLWSVGITLFYMLFGIEPSGEQEEMKDNAITSFLEEVKVEKLDSAKKFLGEAHYSQIIELISKCLKLEIKERITAKEALNLPLFTGLKCPSGFLTEAKLTTSTLTDSHFYLPLKLSIGSPLVHILTIDLFERLVFYYGLKSLKINSNKVLAILLTCLFISLKLEMRHDLAEKEINKIAKDWGTSYQADAIIQLELLLVDDLGFCLYPHNLGTSLQEKIDIYALRFVTEISSKPPAVKNKFRQRQFSDLSKLVS
jgi:serine/threonine protein kinase